MNALIASALFPYGRYRCDVRPWRAIFEAIHTRLPDFKQSLHVEDSPLCDSSNSKGWHAFALSLGDYNVKLGVVEELHMTDPFTFTPFKENGELLLDPYDNHVLILYPDWKKSGFDPSKLPKMWVPGSNHGHSISLVGTIQGDDDIKETWAHVYDWKRQSWFSTDGDTYPVKVADVVNGHTQALIYAVGFEHANLFDGDDAIDEFLRYRDAHRLVVPETHLVKPELRIPQNTILGLKLAVAAASLGLAGASWRAWHRRKTEGLTA